MVACIDTSIGTGDSRALKVFGLLRRQRQRRPQRTKSDTNSHFA